MKQSQIDAVKRYRAKALDRITIEVKKGFKDKWKQEAEKRGMSLQGFIKYAVDLCIQNKD